MIEVPLTRGRVALVDDEDSKAVLVHRWCVRDTGRRLYAGRRGPDGGIVLLHTFLTGYAVTDHINGDGLDNRRSNLREATPSQNQHNRAKQSNNTSGYKGVSQDRRDGVWFAFIGVAGRRRHLGRYSTPEEAAAAYDAAAMEYHGEFARLNFPHINKDVRVTNLEAEPL